MGMRLRTPDSWKLRETKFPLTPTLSPGERGAPSAVLGMILVSAQFHRWIHLCVRIRKSEALGDWTGWAYPALSRAVPPIAATVHLAEHSAKKQTAGTSRLLLSSTHYNMVSARIAFASTPFWLGIIALSVPAVARADETWEFSVQVSAEIQTSPPAILFSWPQDVATFPRYYTVSRKTPEATAWGPAIVLPGDSTSYLDTNVIQGVAYEYQFYKYTTDHVGYGYICSGIQLPMLERRGKIVLLVDQAHSADLSFELNRLQQDLVGDGWLVLRHDVARSTSVPEVKALIQADYDADPANVRALFLFGRIPVPYSGESSPDGHPDVHNGAWPADVFYGVFDGVWTDTTVSNITADYSRNWNVPGDGKFDQSEIPGSVALEIGRVDFDNMPGIDANGLATFPSELELLRGYLNKDHNYRHKVFSVPARGLVFNQTGDRGGEAFADDAWRNYAPLLGPPSVAPLGLYQFIPILQTNGYLWAYATGGSAPNEMSGLGGSGDLYQGTSVDFVRKDIQTVFTMLLGSWIGDWDMQDNLMRAVLATPTYGLSCAYAGRPHWFFHYMGIGETLGYCARLTQNNHAGGLYQNETNAFAGYVHITLLGDPTLRLQTVAPPSGLAAAPAQGTVTLSWSASPDHVVGYHVYRSADPAGPFVRLTSAPVSATSFVDSNTNNGSTTYMVRAVALQTSPSGTYFNPSQGIFAMVQIATPVITWTNPAAIVYGSSLSAIQLNAAASVPGTFQYNPAMGTVLSAGTNTLSVTFIPTDTTNYCDATARVAITVYPAPPPSLAFARIGKAMVLTWDGPSVLQSATAVTGPYQDIPGANSSFTNNLSSSAQQFFRLRR
jgi:hypothetical protein